MKISKYLLAIIISLFCFAAVATNCYMNVEKLCPTFAYQSNYPEGPVNIICYRHFQGELGMKTTYFEAKRDMTSGIYCTLYPLVQRCDYNCIATLVSDGSYVWGFATYRFQTNNCATNRCLDCTP